MHAGLIYPHQMFSEHPALETASLAVLVEDPLFFRQYRFHVRKLIQHRASFLWYAEQLKSQGIRVLHVRSNELERTEGLGEILKQQGVRQVSCVDPVDDWLQRRLQAGLHDAGIEIEFLPDPHFLTPRAVFEDLQRTGRKWFFTSFYISRRKELGLLVEDGDKPLGGKWSFDPENRKKLPRGLVVPKTEFPAVDDGTDEAKFLQLAHLEISEEFPAAPGACDGPQYPISPRQAERMLQDFLQHRFHDFGAYEDAIDSTETFLFHSVLTPSLNTGLLSPGRVLDAAIECADGVPLNSLEGFVRQVAGWREYIRGVYSEQGRDQRTSNFFSHDHQMPTAFYDGSTGIEPVDCVIQRVQKYAWCHHIERLMILGNFMLLCEIRPHDVYRWFMEMFIDAYDWVMVPNIYGMSQFADGGRITTKPYISGSSYVLRMSSFRRGDWCAIWDALYWRFIHRNRDFFGSNPRMSMMVRQCDRMGAKLDDHLQTADDYLRWLHGSHWNEYSD